MTTTREDHDIRVQRAIQYADDMAMVENMVGTHEQSIRNARIGAYMDGFVAGAEAAGAGELLAENNQLHGMFLALDMPQKRVVLFDRLLFAANIEALKHKYDCGCELCLAVEACLEE